MRSPVHDGCIQQSNVHNPKKVRGYETGYRSQLYESFHRNTTLSDGTSLIGENILKQGYYMTKLDLKDAFFSVAVHPQSQKFLRLHCKTKAYRFKALPFGLNIAPMIFTRQMRLVVGHLRKQDVLLVICPDNMLIIGTQPEETTLFSLMTMQLLESL